MNSDSDTPINHPLMTHRYWRRRRIERIAAVMVDISWVDAGVIVSTTVLGVNSGRIVSMIQTAVIRAHVSTTVVQHRPQNIVTATLDGLVLDVANVSHLLTIIITLIRGNNGSDEGAINKLVHFHVFSVIKGYYEIYGRFYAHA